MEEERRLQVNIFRSIHEKKYDPGFDDNDTARIYVSGAAGDNQLRLTSCVWFLWCGL